MTPKELLHLPLHDGHHTLEDMFLIYDGEAQFGFDSMGGCDEPFMEGLAKTIIDAVNSPKPQEATSYARDPKTAVIEGLSSALANIDTQRESGDLSELSLTHAERDRIIEEITYYVQSRFDLTWKA